METFRIGPIMGIFLPELTNFVTFRGWKTKALRSKKIKVILKKIMSERFCVFFKGSF